MFSTHQRAWLSRVADGPTVAVVPVCLHQARREEGWTDPSPSPEPQREESPSQITYLTSTQDLWLAEEINMTPGINGVNN